METPKKRRKTSETIVNDITLVSKECSDWICQWDTQNYKDRNPFNKNKQLYRVSFGENVKNVYKDTFWDISVLSVELPPKCTVLACNLFKHQRFLTSVTIPKSVTYICHGCFYGCTNLAEVIFQENPDLTISFLAFAKTKLEKIRLPDNAQLGGISIFEDCDSLKEISIPVNAKLVYRCMEGVNSSVTIYIRL